MDHCVKDSYSRSKRRRCRRVPNSCQNSGSERLQLFVSALGDSHDVNSSRALYLELTMNCACRYIEFADR